ncbi:21016_t:CDS:2 [Rhizophagus irregularis]|nr:21016_t:CDS:2 [Rhizophagus irregularis]
MIPNQIIELKEHQETLRIPKGKSGYIFGPDSSNLNRIRETSGADVIITGKRNQSCQAIITGTKEQRSKAVVLLQESLGRSNSYSPIIGFTLLDIIPKLLLPMLSFKKVPSEDGCKSSVFPNDITHCKYTLEINPSPPNYSSFLSLRHDCLAKIVDQISNKNLSHPSRNRYGNFHHHQQQKIIMDNSDNEFRLKINFGRELFTKISKTNLNLSEWNNLKRGYNGITTAFRHDISFFDDEKIQKLKNTFGFKEINNFENKVDDREECFITVLYKEKEKKNKFKLQWDANEGRWKIIKSTKNISRQAIIDIVSGRSKSPDLRFLLKSQKRSSPISEKNHNIIYNIQKSDDFLKRNENKYDDSELMYFSQKDFNGKFKCTSVRQSIIKKQLTNDKYQMNFISTLQDEDGRITLEDTVNLINLSWISSPSPNSCESITTMDPKNPKFNESIIDTIDYARNISRAIGD